jgi:hypothetical protein
MSILGGVGGGLFQLISGIRATATNAINNAVSAGSSDPGSTTASQSIPGEHHHRGHHGGLFQQVAAAVTSALQAGQSGSSTNADTTIKNAIAKILGQLASAGSKTGSLTPAANDPDGDGDTDVPGQPENDATAAVTSFLQTLQSAGVTPQQFRQDFLAALQSIAGAQNDPTSQAQVLPPGSLVNQVA